jgi:hypothetical protein
MPAECEVTLGNGQPCRVLAIGRCDVDGRAFCATHQAREESRGPGWGWFPLNRCTPCYSAQMQEARQRHAEQEALREKRFSYTYLTEVAPGELEAAEVPPVEIVRAYSTQGRGLFGRPSRSAPTVQHVEVIATGWLIGSLHWGYNDGGNYGGIDYNNRDTLTALVPIDRWVIRDAILRNELVPIHPLYRVVKTAHGYQLGSGYTRSRPSMEEASAAVHLLLGGTANP